MVINGKKTKSMIFNFTDIYEFTTRLELNNEIVEVIKSTQLLGTIIITDHLKWDLNTATIVKTSWGSARLRPESKGVGRRRRKKKYYDFKASSS